AVVGSGSGAAIQRDDAGWAPREAVLVHLGGEVLVVRSDGSGERRLRVGDSLRLAAAELTLVGLLPLPAETDGGAEPERAAAAAGEAPEAHAVRAELPAAPWMPTL